MDSDLLFTGFAHYRSLQGISGIESKALLLTVSGTPIDLYVSWWDAHFVLFYSAKCSVLQGVPVSSPLALYFSD
jgi:hypothetical protein